MTAHSSRHLWLALSPHGYGHAAMTAPVIAAIQARVPGLRLTIQTGVADAFLATRYRGYRLVPEIADFGFLMNSSTSIDLEASAAAYAALDADFDALVERDCALLRQDPPDLVLSNVAFIPLAAAARLGIPAMALSSLNWADMYHHYFRDRPEAPRVLSRLRQAYESAECFLRCTPAQAMSLANLRDIGPVGRAGVAARAHLHDSLGLGEGERVGLIAFGGINHALPMADWPVLPGWHWLSSMPGTPVRPDLRRWEEAGLSFADLLASVDLVVTKPGYGTFVEAGLSGIPVLYVPRDDWPECPHLDQWLARHARCRPVAEERLFGPALAEELRMLFSSPQQPLARANGVEEAADLIARRLTGDGAACQRS